MLKLTHGLAGRFQKEAAAAVEGLEDHVGGRR